MRQLWLLRHAEAAWPGADEDDLERPLTAAGQAVAAALGPRLQAACGALDRVLCSPAQRARATARRALLGFVPMPPLQIEARIYDASLPRLLALLAEQPPACHRLLLVGHNPRLSELAQYFAVEPVPDMAPGAVLGFAIDAPSWSELVTRKAAAAPQWLQP